MTCTVIIINITDGFILGVRKTQASCKIRSHYNEPDTGRGVFLLETVKHLQVCDMDVATAGTSTLLEEASLFKSARLEFCGALHGISQFNYPVQFVCFVFFAGEIM